MVRPILIIIVLFSNSVNIMSQEIDNKYLLSIIYLRSNLEINKEIKEFFKKDISKNAKYVPFHISNEICYIDIEIFKDSILEFDSKFDAAIIVSKRDFEKEYGFTTFKLEILKNLLPVSDGDLTLYFSKPIGNILVMEFTNFHMSANSGIKFGKGFRILFQFNERGTIENVYRKTFIYN